LAADLWDEALLDGLLWPVTADFLTRFGIMVGIFAFGLAMLDELGAEDLLLGDEFPDGSFDAPPQPRSVAARRRAPDPTLERLGPAFRGVRTLAYASDTECCKPCGVTSARAAAPEVGSTEA
jgi:hypothetical protein